MTVKATNSVAERYKVAAYEWEAGAIVRVSVFDTATTSLTTLLPLETIEAEHRMVRAIAIHAAEADPRRATARIEAVDLNTNTRCLEYRLVITR